MTESIRVVLVDDHRMLVDTMTRAFAAEPDLEVVAVADNVASALAAVALHQPDVVVLDYHLPDGTGVDAVADMKSASPGLEAVLITGDIDHDSVLEAIDAGCLGFVTKDRALADLVRAVRSVARGEPAIGPDVLRRLVRRNERSVAFGALTARELAVLERLAAGRSNEVIAAELFVSLSTVRNHIQSILTKLDSHSKLEAVVKAVSSGLVQIGDPA